eukprot:5419533-Lingulodinium_polyedra.AAC.1
MAIPGAFFILRRAVGVTQEQQKQLLAPVEGQLPQHEDQLTQVVAYICRMARLMEHNPMSVSVLAKGNRNLANAYWLETTPAPAPAPPVYSCPTYQVAPAPTAGS